MLTVIMAMRRMKRILIRSIDATIISQYSVYKPYLEPLAYIMFHISQSTEGCREDKLISGRDTDDMETNLSEFLASFVIYSGDVIS